MEEPIVFINVGWMKRYQGNSPSDILEPGNFGYLKKHKGSGHEKWNFLGRNGWVYGYVPRSCGINISRLGARRKDTRLEGVLVVFVARDPKVDDLKVVGWYQNAIVSRTSVFERTFGSIRVDAPIAVRKDDARVLSVADRRRLDLSIPTAKQEIGGFGQSPVWYAEQHPTLVARIRDLIRKGHGTSLRSVRAKQAKPPRNHNTKMRLAVESKAMEWALEYFDDAQDVSLSCKGWDVEATSEAGVIYIEVKGLSGADVSIQLTPNEYAKMNIHKERFLVFVVTNALKKNARARTFRYSKSREKWVSELGEILHLKEMVAAHGTIRV
jgi:hypothetical protein